MDQTTVSAAAGLRSRMEALDMLSNNLANASTGGYKLDREFYSLFRQDETGGSDSSSNTTLPYIQKQWTDFKQGELQPTGNPLDVALNGKGFFAVDGPNGPLYTRNGAFKLSASGKLTTADGYAVRSVGGQPIQATSQSAIEISPQGTVRQDGQELGQIQVVDFSDPSALNKMGSNYFRVQNPLVKPTNITDPSVEQGRIESSNVTPAESAVRMVEIMRQYEMLQKAVSVAADMNKKATDEVARVGS
jgi:flagellar basal-body rod protein FlgF